MRKRLWFFFMMVLPATNAAENNVHFILSEPATLNGAQLKPGGYRIQVEGDKATVKVGKTVIESPVKLETADHKFKVTSVEFEKANGGFRISEIDIGGSTTRIVFSGAVSGQ